MRILSRHDTVENEKCPKCLLIFQHFMDLENGVLACMRCGCVFISKDIRDELVPARVVEILKDQQETNDFSADEAFIAPCGFEAKTKAGMVNHERNCEKCQSLAEKEAA